MGWNYTIGKPACMYRKARIWSGITYHPNNGRNQLEANQSKSNAALFLSFVHQANPAIVVIPADRAFPDRKVTKANKGFRAHLDQEDVTVLKVNEETEVLRVIPVEWVHQDMRLVHGIFQPLNVYIHFRSRTGWPSGTVGTSVSNVPQKTALQLLSSLQLLMWLRLPLFR